MNKKKDKYEIWCQWENGTQELIDIADTEKEAEYLVNEYDIAFWQAAKIKWLKIS